MYGAQNSKSFAHREVSRTPESFRSAYFALAMRSSGEMGKFCLLIMASSSRMMPPRSHFSPITSVEDGWSAVFAVELIVVNGRRGLLRLLLEKDSTIVMW